MISLSNRTTVFEQMPDDIIGNVLDQLNKETGSKGIVNDSDIPVVMRYVCNLACTSQQMNKTINNPEITRVFLQSLSNKYGKSCEHFAALLNTVGARKWLWNYISKNGDDKSYQVIQDIYELASDAIQETKQIGLKFEYSEGREKLPSPNSFYDQTKQGFVLYNDWAPSHIATPFGQIKIYSAGAFLGNSHLSVAEVFIKRLNAVFENVVCGSFNEDRSAVFEIASSSRSDAMRKISQKDKKKISKEELKQRRGTQNLIASTLPGNYSSYKIREIKGKKLVDVVYYNSKKRPRSYELIQCIWDMLEMNRLEMDPIAKKEKTENIVKQSILTEEPLFKNISEVFQWSIEAISKLEQQPVFEGEKWLNMPTKLLVLGDYTEARMIEILNSGTEKFLDKDAPWSIHAFGCGNNQRFLDGEILGDGIELWIYEENKPCDLSVLGKAYSSVIRSIGQNWVKSELKDFPAVLHAESEEDYVLFIKKGESIRDEDLFIGYVALKLGLSEFICCGNRWKSGTLCNLLYMWIKKDKLEKVLDSLNISSYSP